MLPVLISLSGCVYLVVGSIGALGGYVVSPDTVEGSTLHDGQTVWEQSLEVLEIMGTIREKSEDSQIVLADVNGTRVTVSVIPMGPNQTTLRVKSRKMMFPKISISQNVYVKIMGGLPGTMIDSP